MPKYKENQKYQKVIDRRKIPLSHKIIYGRNGSGKTYVIQKEIRNILSMSDDMIYVFSVDHNYKEFHHFNKTDSIRFCECPFDLNDIYYSDILQHIGQKGRELLESKKRVWVYFDMDISMFDDKEFYETFHYFFRSARMNGLILTFTLFPSDIECHLSQRSKVVTLLLSMNIILRSVYDEK